MAAAGLTMQAVADALGVSRKALHYYVGDREGLLTLVVFELFDQQLNGVELPSDGDWRAVLSAYAVAYRDGLVELGAVTDFTQLHGLSVEAALALAERVLDALLTAGFDPDSARYGLTAASNIAQSAAQAIVAQTAAGEHRHRAQTSAALQREPHDTYPALRRVLASADSQGHDAERQFEFELDLLIAGLDRLLSG